jgi:hypothetical protein
MTASKGTTRSSWWAERQQSPYGLFPPALAADAVRRALPAQAPGRRRGRQRIHTCSQGVAGFAGEGHHIRRHPRQHSRHASGEHGLSSDGGGDGRGPVEACWCRVRFRRGLVRRRRTVLEAHLVVLVLAHVACCIEREHERHGWARQKSRGSIQRQALSSRGLSPLLPFR